MLTRIWGLRNRKVKKVKNLNFPYMNMYSSMMSNPRCVVLKNEEEMAVILQKYCYIAFPSLFDREDFAILQSSTIAIFCYSVTRAKRCQFAVELVRDVRDTPGKTSKGLNMFPCGQPTGIQHSL